MSSEWPVGLGRIILDETDSTNAEALRSDVAPAWILARRQTAGRGRRGRAWITPPGNLAASLALRPDMPPDRAALYSFVAALALHDALSSLTDRALALKWPNDVLLDGGKVAGILLEASGGGNAVERLAIGFGVNLVAAPPMVERCAATPVALESDIGVEAFLDRLARAFADRDAIFRRDGFEPIREAWLARAARLGKPIVARAGSVTSHGVFEGVDTTGALILGGSDGRRSIAAADVFF